MSDEEDNSIDDVVHHPVREINLVMDHLHEDEDLEEKKLTLKSLEQILPQKNIFRKVVLKLAIETCMTDHDMKFLQYCANIRRKNVNEAIRIAQSVLKVTPNYLWAHILLGATWMKGEDQDKGVLALSSSVLVNPNCLSAWTALYKHYESLGGLYSEQYAHQMYLVISSLLTLEPDIQDWLQYIRYLYKYILWTKHNHDIIFQLLYPYLKNNCVDKRNAVARIFVTFAILRKMPDKFEPSFISAFTIHLKSLANDSMKFEFFYTVINMLLSENHTACCDFIVQISEENLLNYNMVYVPLKNFIITELFYALQDRAFKAINCLNKNFDYSKPLTCSSSQATAITYLAGEKYSKIIQDFAENVTKQNQIVYLKALEKLESYEEFYMQLYMDLCEINGKESNLLKWYLQKFITICGRSNDHDVQQLILKIALKYFQVFGLNCEILYIIGLISVSLNKKMTLRHVTDLLLDHGYFSEVLYLKALSEKDVKLKLKYAKNLPISANKFILLGQIYNEMKSPKKMLIQFLKAADQIDYLYIPFEWLGLYYLENGSPSRASKYFDKAHNNNMFSWVTINYLSTIYSNYISKKAGKYFLDGLRSTKLRFHKTIIPICFKAGLLHLYEHEQLYDYYVACENFRMCLSKDPNNRVLKELIADAYRNFGKYESSMSFYKDCFKENNTVHVYALAMRAINAGQAKNYCTFEKMARKSVYCGPMSILALHTWASVLLEKAFTYQSRNYGNYAIFLSQQGIALLLRAISIYSNYKILWKTLGDFFFICGSSPESICSIYVPSWFYRTEKTQKKEVVLIKKNDCLLLSSRCYYIGLQMSKNHQDKSQFWYSLALVFRYMKHCNISRGYEMLTWCRECAFEAVLPCWWQAQNLIGVVLLEQGEMNSSIAALEKAFESGYTSFASEVECNLGCAQLKTGSLVAAYETFMNTRGHNPTNGHIWFLYSLLEACRERLKMIMKHMQFQLKYVRHYPTMAQFCFYYTFFNNSDLEKIDIEYLSSKRFSNVILSKISKFNPVPQKMHEMDLINFYLSGLYQMRCGNKKEAYENLLNVLKIAAHSTLDEDTKLAMNSAVVQLAKLSSNPEDCLKYLEMVDSSSHSSLLKSCAHITVSDNYSAYVELINGLNKNGCLQEARILKSLSTFEDGTGKILLPSKAWTKYKDLMLYHLITLLVGDNNTSSIDLENKYFQKRCFTPESVVLGAFNSRNDVKQTLKKIK